VTPGVVYLAPWIALITVEGLPWPLVTMWATPPLADAAAATAVGAPTNGLLLSSAFFFFFFLYHCSEQRHLHRAFPTFGAGCECQAHPSAALAHLSARLKGSETSCTSCVANFLSIFLSLMPYQNATITEALEMQ
jgi:hypothetical protein